MFIKDVLLFLITIYVCIYVCKFVDLYAERSMEADAFLYTNPDSLIVFAAGNTGADGMDTLYTPCDSKNVLCVGSIDSTDDFTDAVLTEDVRVSYFSSLGPTFDGRIKPDVVAPGFKVVSAMAPSFGSSSSCATVEMFGTSMATPLVSGLALLARQYFNGGMWKSVCRSQYTSCVNFMPSGMLSKAVIIHSAEGVNQYSHQDFDGATAVPSTNLGSPPDNFQGFGAVRLGNVLPTTVEAARKRDLYVVDLYSIASYTTHTLQVYVAAAWEPLKVTLVWYDRANAMSTTGTLLIDNLDLTVVSPSGTVYYGNNVVDLKNTVERVVIDSPDAGRTYTVKIKASAFSGGISQRFALVVSCSGYVSSQLQIAASRRLDESPSVPEDVTEPAHSASATETHNKVEETTIVSLEDKKTSATDELVAAAHNLRGAAEEEESATHQSRKL